MLNKIDQQISEMIDDELTSEHREKLICSIKSDSSKMCKWERYHLISDAMRNTLPNHIDNSLSKRIQNALESEPAILAPNSEKRTHIKHSGPTIVSLPPVVRGKSHGFRPVVGLATAAMVGAMSWFGLQLMDNPGASAFPVTANELVSNEPSHGQAAVAVNVSAPVTAQNSNVIPFTPNSVLSPVLAEQQWKRLGTDNQQVLGPYIVEHSEATNGVGIITQGVVPFARVVNFGADGAQ
ncbi:MAG: sigma-E factor negative regulatory protein [Gammaproteobacteria bacterium]|nr:sigma-E factor negative regulatory protein [Gammaproteobacteria bacterium]MDH5691850.1 sigma-E factor negative regulatory protein [Gammaproteobacteria bacterium]